MIIVDTPGTNVILQRQQRLTEEFVPRADLILFVVSADRPLTESEVNFLRYIQQWKKRVIFVLNKSDLYRSSDELEEAIIFIKNNVKKLLNIEDVLLFPVSARSALEKKLLASSGVLGDSDRQPASSQWSANSFNKLENYLYSFLDGSTTTGIERMKLKLFTPVGIAEQLISSCQKTKREECQQSKEDVVLVNDIINSVEEYAKTIDRDSISWKRRSLSLIDNVQSRVLKIAESTLQLSNLDLVSKYIFKGEKSTPMPVTASIQNDIIDPAVSEAEKLITEYTRWLQSTNAQKGSFYRESLEKRWPSFVDHLNQNELATSGFLLRKHETSIKVIRNFNAAAVAKQFEKEIRETFLVTFGGLAAAGLSASLLTSVLPTTLEDLLALGLCSAGGLVAISNFPARRQRAIDKVKKTAGVLAHELEEAMQNDLLESASSLENYVKLIGKPYQEAAQDRLDKVLGTLNELSVVEKDLKTLQTEIQNLHISQ
ncbi:hypothetical protein Leryth_000603 [Lithospermum erythrorhizon]|nr:hypothetical protein Leryth_000603 [Lithospermum erythrorhizon]